MNEKEPTTEIGRLVARQRTALGISQKEIADRAGVTPQYLSSVVNATLKLPSADIRRRLADALGVRHVDILVAFGELTRDEAGPAPADSPVEREFGRLTAGMTDAQRTAVLDIVRGALDLRDVLERRRED